jgi:hypothetical protein
MKATYTLTPGTTYSLKRQRGASLLEGIAYLGIAALVVLGAVSLLSSAYNSLKTNQTIEELISLRTSVKKLYAGQAFGASANLLLVLVPARTIPATLQVNGNAVSNSWGGAVTVASNVAGDQFSIAYTLVPRDVCVGIISGTTGWVQVTDGTTPINAFPATPAQALATCPNATNTITFTST